jgi:ABC-type glycerol-3-phosphate transport system permease component
MEVSALNEKEAADDGGIVAAFMITLLPVLAVFLAFRTRTIEGVPFTGIKD